MVVKRVFNLFTSKDKRRALRRDATPQEIILWSRLRGARIFDVKFRRQYGVGSYVVDFYCIERKVVVEIDGSQHFEVEALEYDKRRTDFLEQYGCRVLRFTNSDINTNLDGVLQIIGEELR